MREARETGDADRQQEISDVHSWLWGFGLGLIKRILIPLAFGSDWQPLEDRTHLVSESFSAPRRHHAIREILPGF
jgi:hypothetical protein